MDSSNNAFSEGRSIARPPMFDSTEYACWKTRMRIFVDTIDTWDIVESEYSRSKITVDNLEVDKPRDQWTTNESKLHRENGKAMNPIIFTLDKTEYNHVSHCVSTQKIWHVLEVTYEGTSQVKKSHLAMLSNEYENFSMSKEESIKEMYEHFSTLVYKSNMLGKPYSDLEVVHKILRILLRNFEAKVTTIQESKDLKTIKVKDPIENLTTYEMEVKYKEKHEDRASK